MAIRLIGNEERHYENSSYFLRLCLLPGKFPILAKPIEECNFTLTLIILIIFVRKELPFILEDAENGLTHLSRELFAEQYQKLKEALFILFYAKRV